MRFILSVLLVAAFSDAAFAEATIKSGAYEPITKASSPKLFKAWGKAGIERINAAVERAVKLAAQSDQCDEVWLSGYSFDRSEPKKAIAVFAECTNGQRFNFTEEETKAANAAPVSLSSALNEIKDSDALLSCETLTKEGLRFKSTMNVSYLNSNVDRGEHAISVHLVFEAKNALGASLPYESFCSIDEKKTQLISLKER